MARSKAVAAAGTAVGATALLAPVAEAATITVTSLEDDGSGGTTLREAILEANSDSDSDVIVFQSGLSGTIELEGSQIVIDNGPLDIQGPGASVITVDAAAGNRIFYARNFDDPDTAVRIAGLTMTGGDLAGHGGAILSYDINPVEAADLTIADSVFTGNQAAATGGALFFELGDLTITGSAFSDNQASSGGAIVAAGGEITVSDTTIFGNQASTDNGGLVAATDGDLTVSGTTISGNDAGDAFGGGQLGAFGASGDLLLRSSTVSGNAADVGGGIVTSAAGAMTIDASTFSNNTAVDSAGGLLLGDSSDGPTVVQNSTFSGNTATGGASVGGGILSDNGDDTPRTIRNSTIVGNSAGHGGGVFSVAEDGPEEGNDILGLRSSIVSGNTATEAGSDIYQPPGSDGEFELGFSLVGSTSDAETSENPAGSNHFGIDPQLGPLASNGGPTQTHGLALTSPAIDKGIANGLATDQRGLARTGDLSLFANATAGDATDIGAVELQAADCKGQGALRLDGTAGDDTLTGTAGPDSISGADGADRLNGVGAPDCLNGDAGRDRLNGGGGADRINGGSGKDKAKGQGGKDTVRGGGGKDNLKGNGGKDKLRGQGGKDKLNGGGGKDKLFGGGGKDKLRGGPAKDRLKGQGGKDKLNAVDGKRDKVNCGGGKDRATVDPEDKVSGNCEKVIVKG